MARAKVCGVTRREDLEVAVDAGAAAVGFVVDVPVDTPREVEPARAEELAALVPPYVTGTLVTVSDSAAEVVTLADLVGVDAVQVHGLTSEDVAVVAETFPGDVVAAVGHGADFAAYAGAADALLVDSLDDEGAGGTGETHDWNRTREVAEAADAPVVLAGGLTPENVREAVRTVRPYAVDVASGVESAGGVKDAGAVRAFVEGAWEAERVREAGR